MTAELQQGSVAEHDWQQPENPRALSQCILYGKWLTRPLDLQNHTQIIRHRMDLELLRKRQMAIYSYLCHENGYSTWGGSLFAEIVAGQLIRTVFSQQFRDNNLAMRSAPSSMDQSVRRCTPLFAYQKGADLCVVEKRLANNARARRHLVGIDVTIHPDEDVVKQKKAQPGIQCNSGMPVIVVALGRVGTDSLDFWQYMEAVRQKLLETTELDPPVLSFLSGRERKQMRQSLLAEMLSGTEDAMASLTSGVGTHPVADYPYLGDSIMQLHTTKRMVLKEAAGLC